MKDKVNYENIENIVVKTPNDTDLGKKIREIINQIKYENGKKISNNSNP